MIGDSDQLGLEGLKSKPSTLDLEALRQRSEESLYFFAKGILGYDWLVPHIHKPVCKSLENLKIKRRVIKLPRTWLKTTLCTIAYPIWRSIKDPNIRILITQNSATNAVKKLAIIKNQWESNSLLRTLYPNLLPTSDCTWRSDSICLNRDKSSPESTYEAAGTNTTVVSRHYDIVIEDDTVAPDLDELGIESMAPSSDDVEKAIGWHRTNVLPLLTDLTTGDVLIVGTRWYELDLIAWVVENEPQYKVISRACREDEEGNPDPKGEITYPERFNEKVLQELEASLGPYLFSCLYMNTPIRISDMLFKPEWIHYYDTAPRSLAVYTTLDPATDPALAKGRDIDYSVIMTCGKDLVDGRIYVLEYTRRRMDPGEIVQELFRHVLTYRPIVVGYEDIAFQRSLDFWIKNLMRQEDLYFNLEPVDVRKKDKGSRIRGLQPMFAAGTIFLRTHMKELESELTQYPLGRHDDIIDALSMQHRFWKRTRGAKADKECPDNNPLSFERALKEIDARRLRGIEDSYLSSPLQTLSEMPIA